MIKQAYINGFMRKCAERGVDIEKLVKFAEGKNLDTHPAFSEDYGKLYKDMSRSSFSSPQPVLGYPTSIFSRPSDGLMLSTLFDEHGKLLPIGHGGLYRGSDLGLPAIRGRIAYDLWDTERLAGSWYKKNRSTPSVSNGDGGTLTPALKSALYDIVTQGKTTYNPRLAGTGGGKNGFIYGR